MKQKTILSLEQALSLPSATLRFMQLGWRVIRIEATPVGSNPPGDPNRYIGKQVAEQDRHSYYIAPNVGKEAICLNLKTEEGRAALHQMIRELDVDVFCVNTLPSRYEALGIDYETLKAIKPDIIWAGISAMGPEYPNVPGYDPVLQAMSGFMDMTGPADGNPLLMGLPIIDLKAGDELYANVCLGLADRAETGRGRRIDVSMLQVAASWLIQTLPLIDYGNEPHEYARSGNEHRNFVPSNVYPTSDGYIYISIGNDRQWHSLTTVSAFTAIAREARDGSNGRKADRKAIHKEIASITRTLTTDQVKEMLQAVKVPHSPILSVAETRDHPAIAAKLTSTTSPSGAVYRMQPMPVDLPGNRPQHFPFAPRYGEHTRKILLETGHDDAQCDALFSSGAVAGGSK